MSAKNGQIKNCEHCGVEMYVKKCLLKRKRFCSRYCLGKNTPLAKYGYMRNMTAWNKGKKLHYNVWNKGLKGYRAGEDNNNWKGGITPLLDRIRTCTEYKNWRMRVFQRDNFSCKECGRYRKKGDRVNIHADHIKPLSILVRDYDISSLDDARRCKDLWDIFNGRTLCVECHKNTPTYGCNFIRWNIRFTAQKVTN